MSTQRKKIDSFLKDLRKKEYNDKINTIVQLKRSCDTEFDKEKLNLLISVPSDANLEINVRQVAIDQISELSRRYEQDKSVTIKDEINKLCLKLLSLKVGDFDTISERDFRAFRAKIIECLTINGKENETIFDILVGQMETEQDEKIRRQFISGINSINPVKATEILFKYLIDDPSVSVRYRIHNLLRDNLREKYQWSTIAGYFTEEFLVNVFMRKEYDIKSCFIKTLEFGGRNPLHEKFLIKLILDEDGDLRVRKEALSSLGCIGSEGSIVRLSTIKEKGGIFQDKADEGLANFSERLTYEKEKLVDVFVRQHTNIKQLIIKISSIISGLVTLGLTIAGLTSSNYTESQIKNIGRSTVIFASIFIALVFIFLIIPSLYKYNKVSKIKKEIREKFKS